MGLPAKRPRPAKRSLREGGAGKEQGEKDTRPLCPPQDLINPVDCNRGQEDQVVPLVEGGGFGGGGGPLALVATKGSI